MRNLSAFQPRGSTKAYYTFNGNSIDISSNGNHGTDTSIIYPKGRFGQCASFNGTTSKITNTFFEDPDTYNSGMTISHWCYVTSNQDGRPFVWFDETGSWGSIYTQMQNGKYEGRFGSGSTGFVLDSLVTTKIGKWVHLCITHDTSNNIFYVDGIRTNSQTAQTLANTGTTLYFGFNGNYLNGMIDEVIVESRAWTAKEVETYYRKSLQNYRPKTMAQMLISFLVSETATLTESITNIRQRLFSVSETSTLTESITARLGKIFTILETTTVSEVITTSRGFLTRISESVGLTEILVQVKAKWNELVKSSSSWSEKSDNTATWTEKSDNNSTWTEKTKN